VARWYLVSDILHNSTAKVTNASFFRRGFEERLPQIVAHLHATFRAIIGRIRAEQFKVRENGVSVCLCCASHGKRQIKVLACLQAWEDWSLYPIDFLLQLRMLFLTGPASDAAKTASDAPPATVSFTAPGMRWLERARHAHLR
jgi:U2-associated protein SR140